MKHAVKQAARLTQLGDTGKTLEWTGTDYTGLQHNRVNKSPFKIIQHYIKQVWLSCHLSACCSKSVALTWVESLQNTHTQQIIHVINQDFFLLCLYSSRYIFLISFLLYYSCIEHSNNIQEKKPGPWLCSIPTRYGSGCPFACFSDHISQSARPCNKPEPCIWKHITF